MPLRRSSRLQLLEQHDTESDGNRLKRKLPDEQRASPGKKFHTAQELHKPRRLRTRHRQDSESHSEDKATIEPNRRLNRTIAREQEKKGDQNTMNQEHTPESAETVERKPWETLIIGADLGQNLSYIEEKDREILQQRYMLEHHKKHSPGQVGHHEKLLEELIYERAQMVGDEGNFLPA